jgi:predicted nucleic acid-binding protein
VTRLAYVDASALVKLVIDEPGSSAMHHWYVEADEVATNRIGIVETIRAVGRRDHDPAHLRAVLSSLVVLELDVVTGEWAGVVAPATVRTLDASHIASALAMGSAVDAFVTYDERQADAARAAGLPVVSPAA